MATSEELRARIRAVQELQGLVRIMRALAAVKSRTYSAAVISARAYAEVVSDGLRVLLRDLPPGMEPRASGPGVGVLVAFGSDQGMCGSFNRRAAQEVQRQIREEPEGRRPLLLVAGLRLAGELEDQGLAPDLEMHLPGSVEGVVAAGREIVTQVDRMRSAADAAYVRVVHNRPTGGMGYDTISHQLVPFGPRWLSEKAAEPWPGRCIPMHFGSAGELLAEVVRQHLYVSIFRAFAESMAAENSARLGAMESASRNVGERLEQLERDFHQIRQSAITEELLDVSAGFEVLGGSGL